MNNEESSSKIFQECEYSMFLIVMVGTNVL